LPALFEGGAELGVGGDAAGDEYRGGVELPGGEHGAIDEIADDGVLEFADERECLRGAEREELFEFAFATIEGVLAGEDFGAVFAVFAEVVEDGGLDAAEAEVERVAPRFGGREFHGSGCCGVRGGGEAVEDWSAGVAEGKELGDLVVGFASGVVTRLRDFFVGERWLRWVLRDFVEDGVAAGDDETDGGQGGPLPCFVGFEEDGVDVAFKMIYRDERFVESLRERFGVGDADEERADEARTLGDADGVDVVECEIGFGEGFANDGDDLAKVFARGEFGDDAAVLAVDVDLRGDDAGENFAAVGDDGGSGFVAGGFDAEDARGHSLILAWRIRGALWRVGG
jgi:hypothetical protein